MRVVSVQDADEGTPAQEWRQVEAATEDNVGRDTEKDCWKSFSALDVWGLLELRGWCYHGDDGAKGAVWMCYT